MSRRNIRDVGTVKARRNAMCVLERHEVNEMDNLALILAFCGEYLDGPDVQEDLLVSAMLCAARAEELRADIHTILEPVERRYLRFTTASIQSTFSVNFRFRQENMVRLMRCLRVPAEFMLDNGSWVNGQEGLLIMLHMLAYPARLIDKEEMFGWELSRLSRINKRMKILVYVQFKQLLKNNWAWHVPHLRSSKRAWQQKKLSLHPQVPLNPRTAEVCQAYDGFRVTVSRPQSVGNPGAVLDIQAEVYSGYTKTHNFLYLTATNAFGLVTFLDGPHLGRGTDRTAFRDSNIRARYEAGLEAAGANPADLCAIGDKIFVDRVPCFLALRMNPTAQELAYERIESKLRTSVENVHSKVVENWKGLRMKSNMKIGLGHVSVDVHVAFILTNALTLLQGSQVHTYFADSVNDPGGLEMPTAESYFGAPPL
jgi:hypothetical protein